MVLPTLEMELLMELKELVTLVEYIKDKLDVVCDAVIGTPGDQNKPGVLIRLDRVERVVANVRRVVFLLSSAVIGVVGTIVAALIIRSV